MSYAEHTEKRLAALRAEKKKRLRWEHGIETCEVCSGRVDLNRPGYYADEEGCYLCAPCYREACIAADGNGAASGKDGQE